MSTPIVVLYNLEASLTVSEVELRHAIVAMEDRGLPIRLSTLPRDKPWRGQIDALIQEGAGTLVAAGGDGTVNAIASCLLGTDCRLGIVPIGTLNLIAKQLHIPLDVTAALELIIQGHGKQIDAAQVNGLTFLHFSSLGIYAEGLMEHIERQRLGWHKRLALLSAIPKMIRHSEPLQLRFLQGNQATTVATPLLMIANHPLNIANAASLSDREHFQSSRLHVAYLPPGGRLAPLHLGLSILRNKPLGTALASVGLTSFDIEAQQERLQVSLDGDIRIMEPPLHYSCCPRALHVICPEAESDRAGSQT